jgi:hypothetical protein
MQPVSPNRWRALPTVLIVIGAIALGAATARADAAGQAVEPPAAASTRADEPAEPGQPTAASTSAATR